MLSSVDCHGEWGWWQASSDVGPGHLAVRDDRAVVCMGGPRCLQFLDR